MDFKFGCEETEVVILKNILGIKHLHSAMPLVNEWIFKFIDDKIFSNCSKNIAIDFRRLFSPKLKFINFKFNYFNECLPINKQRIGFFIFERFQTFFKCIHLVIAARNIIGTLWRCEPNITLGIFTVRTRNK